MTEVSKEESLLVYLCVHEFIMMNYVVVYSFRSRSFEKVS